MRRYQGFSGHGSRRRSRNGPWYDLYMSLRRPSFLDLLCHSIVSSVLVPDDSVLQGVSTD